jgi:CRP-like cAMP-binding protein
VSKTAVHLAGTAIFEEGDEGRTRYAIKRGKAAVMVGGKTVATLAEEQVFGEMALLDHAPRTAAPVRAIAAR